MIINRIFKIFIPEYIAGDFITDYYAKNFIWVCLISLLVSPVYAFIMYYFHDYASAYAIMANICVLLLALVSFKLNRSLLLSGTFYTSSLAIIIIYVAYNQGGLDSKTIYWLITPSLIATFINGIRAGVIWCLITTLIASVFYYLSLIHFEFPISPITEPDLLKYVGLCNLNIIILSLVIIYDSTRNNILISLKKIAYRDALTGLPNKLSHDNFLTTFMSDSNRDKLSFTIFYIDLNNFKKINITFGTEIGNILLKRVAKRIKRHMIEASQIARVGGDEFKIIIEKKLDNQDIKEIADIIIALLKIPFHIKKQNIHIQVGIGIVSFESTFPNIINIERYLDIALREAKTKGGNSYEIFSENLKTEALRKISIEEHLTKAIAHNELYLTYQPMFSAKDPNKITYIEVLLRWNSKALGNILPSLFVPIAESINVISNLDKWALREACKQYVNWRNNNLISKIPFTINISAQHLYDSAFLNHIIRAINDTNMAPSDLIIELTETAILFDQPRAAEILLKLNKMGIHTIVDDFGVGQTSLSYLTILPVSGIKIDKIFIDVISENASPGNVVISAMTDLAHKLNLIVISEGIESLEQLNFLRKTGSDALQGFYLSKPLESDSMQALLIKSSSTPPL